jgi:hypothetical protein
MNLWQRKNLVVLCLLALALTLSAQAQRYSVWTPITVPDITQPAAGSTIPIGATVTLRCRPVTDHDYDNLTCSIVEDGATLTWTAKDGSDNDVGEFTDNTGPEATWIAPSAAGTVTITATADDDYPSYLADDPPQQHSHQVNIEQVFRFVAWADNRPRLNAGCRARFHRVVQEINGILCPAGAVYEWSAFHVVPGDYDDTSQTNTELHDNSNFPDWKPAPGNHDDRGDDYDMYHLFNYTVDYQNARFIYLNEYICPADDPEHLNLDGRVCSHIYEWLQGQLTDVPPYVQFMFVVGHEPAFPQGNHLLDSLNVNVDERNDFWSLLNSCDDPPVYAYICGHTHCYSVYSDATGSTLQIDVGNAGNNSPESKQTFVLFEVRPTGITRHAYQGTLEDEDPFEEVEE